MEFPPVLQLCEALEKQEDFTELQNYFKTKFNHYPVFYARVPGRVNLIGEHIDYSGFTVFPMAIEQDIVVAVSPNGNNMLHLTNYESDLFEDYATPVNSLIIDDQNPKWFHYVLCGIKGIVEEGSVTMSGLNMAVVGTIPPSSGLSSSSALVCSSALAAAHSQSIAISKMQIATLCAKSERYIGTQGGGMDQAIAFLAEAGSAKHIQFNPLQASTVPLPKGANFVVANSCVAKNKATSNDFNIRVVECRLASFVLAKAMDLNWKEMRKLKDIPDVLNISLDALVSEIKILLHQSPYTKAEICDILNIEDQELRSYLSKNTQNIIEFKLYQRALHVYEEASRVLRFREICESKSSDALSKLGVLMSQSHRSCRDLYECSHPDLDDLVELSLQAGALGSRLTGAGWGGCCVSLVTSDNISHFLQEIKEKYFMQNPDRMKKLKTSLFATHPGGGAVIYKA